jgi:hypothetical protein
MLGSAGSRKRQMRGRPPIGARVEAVLRLIPSDGSEITAGDIVRKLAQSSLNLPRRTALRWLKEAGDYKPAGPYRLLQTRKSGRNRFYSFAMTGFLDAKLATAFVRGERVTFLAQAASLAPAYATSAETMTLFWKQASAAFVRSFWEVLEVAQSLTFGQVHTRVMPTEAIARRQAQVLVEVFVRNWTTDLIAALHRFLEIERERNWPGRDGKRSHDAPSAIEAYREGWNDLLTAAFEQWRTRRDEGEWGRWVQSQREAQGRELGRSSNEESAANPSVRS